jgi:hypothetical protein
MKESERNKMNHKITELLFFTFVSYSENGVAPLEKISHKVIPRAYLSNK